jgi:Glycosyl hydrolases family 16/IPT/TIG domain
MMRVILVVFATLFFANTALLASGPAFVQVKSATPQAASGSVAVTFTLAQTAGNLNVVVVGWNDATSTVSSVSDSLGNNYVLAIGPTSGTGLRQSIYYAAGIKAGSNTVTARFNQAAKYVDVRALEYSGLDSANPLDAKAGASGSGTSANSGAATTTSANDMIFGAGMTIARFTAAGSGFASRIITTPDADIAEDKTVSTTGSYSATAPNSSGSWVMQMVAFRASGTSGGSSNPAPKVSAISPNAGTASGGAAVTITGTGFQSGVAVTIGGVAATSVTVVSSTSITAKTPAHAAGAADVAVKNTDNQTGGLSGGYTYTSTSGGGTGGSGAPAGATFYDDFSKGSLDTSKWIPSNWGAPGGGSFVPSYLDFSTGMLRIKLTQTSGSSVGGELQSKNALGFGTYEWIMRASSTSSTPNGSGYTVSGQISSGFIYVNNSQTEIDSPEIEGQNPGTLWWTTWTSESTKQYTSTQAPFAPESGFHSYKCVWTRTSIKFYVDGALVSTHTGVVPQTPAYAMINHWGTNSTGWGGLATPNVTRYMFVRSFSFVPGN